MTTELRHAGIVVRDIERALAFYEALGFQLWKRQMEQGPVIDTVVGLPGVLVETAKLKAPAGGLLELLQYHSHPMERPIQRQPSNQLGCSHVALTVTDIDSTVRAVLAHHGNMVNDPIESPSGEVRVAYCYDCEGNLLEIVEEIG